MNLTRRYAGFALAALLLTSCQPKPKRRILGVVAKGRSHLFWQSVHAGAIKAARERGVDISWNAPASEADIAAQVQIVDSFIARRVDAIVLAPIDQTALAAPVERAAKAGIPVVIFDSDVSSQAYAAYVATNNYQGGVIAARRMGELLNGRGQISIVAVQPGAASTMARESGFQDTIRKDFPGIQIVDLRYGNAEFAKSLAAAENQLTAFPQLAAMFASNESSTVGAAQAIKARNSKVKLIGFDWSPNFQQDLIDGRIDALVAQHPFGMGYQSVGLAVDQLDGKPITKRNEIAPRLVRKGDLEIPEVLEFLNPNLKLYLP